MDISQMAARHAERLNRLFSKADIPETLDPATEAALKKGLDERGIEQLAKDYERDLNEMQALAEHLENE